MRHLGPFTPAAILPEQFVNRLRPEPPPEHRLLIAILEDAITCFQKGYASDDRHNRRLFCEAEEWIMSEQYHGPFSFEHVCSILGLDPCSVRCSLRRKQASAER